MYDIPPDLWSTLTTLGTYLLFVLLVVVPVYLNRAYLPGRLAALARGWRRLTARGWWRAGYVPLSLVVLFAAAAGALVLAELVPLLRWGWLGANIIAAPLAPPADAGRTPGVDWSALLPLALVPVIVAAMLLFNYEEERQYRDSYRSVGVWAVLHLVMGIPLFAVIPIFTVGLVYKRIYDRHGLDAAYAVHFATNSVLVTVLVVGTVVLATV
ncbi:hypothetical protein [Halomarina litorea]|uniref:hypothetical protein n=1 Tax=Halomarina litorea TaxID=2961595 RepID=UPI0020C527F3|nr:hypothetical protein [Halomarina sp. BCD28]